ncbi:Crp/Fnr family transcriptional regulator [Georgenia faecalis]|uniref:Crp/Fnr family transcriptional regulator n=1 Tax=Georgenia faecalis TaxID=2483799 RepID=A0ABV9D5Y8_9MICO|nr:Crp/Fnr family transcriptional regulator [Georgenia faecalis]
MEDTAISSVPLFAALDADARQALRESMEEVVLRRGETLFNEGDPGDRLYLVVEGKVKLGHRASDGRENLLAVLGPGELLGELTLFDPGERTATATAIAPTRLLELQHEPFMELIDARPELAKHMLKALAQRLRRTNTALADLVFSDVPGRVAKALLDLSDRFGERTGTSIRVPHDLTQEELAQLVGASRETVNKSLADFVGRGWIRLEGRAVHLLDVERLQRRAR